MAARFRVGDIVIYRKQKSSTQPGPRPPDVHPATKGEFYSYFVDKYWRVVAVNPDNQIVVCTRKGKRHTVPADDPKIRGVRWWDWLLYWHRFPPRTPEEQSRPFG